MKWIFVVEFQSKTLYKPNIEACMIANVLMTPGAREYAGM